jgi:hypothetical protein
MTSNARNFVTCTSHLINMNSETCWWLIWNYISKELDQKPKFLLRGPRWFRSKCCPKPGHIGREPGNTFLCTTLPCYKKCSCKKTHVMIQKCFGQQPVHQLCQRKGGKCWYNFLLWSSMSQLVTRARICPSDPKEGEKDWVPAPGQYNSEL